MLPTGSWSWSIKISLMCLTKIQNEGFVITGSIIIARIERLSKLYISVGKPLYSLQINNLFSPFKYLIGKQKA